MKRCKKIILLALIFILSLSLNVYADSPSAEITFTQSATSVKPGETITISLTAKCATGIEGIESILEWDKTKLEFTNAESLAATGYTSMSDFDDATGKFSLSLFYTGAETPTNAKFAELKFKVLTGVNAEEELSVKLSNIELGDSNDDWITIEDKEIITKVAGNTPEEQNPVLSEIKVSKAPTKTTYKAGEKFDKTGMKVIAVYSDGKSKEITNYTYSPDRALTEADKNITITYKEGNITKTVKQTITVQAVSNNDDGNGTGGNGGSGQTGKEDPKENTAPGKLPQAGLEEFTLILVFGVSIVAILLYIKCKKYTDVK